MTRRRAPFAAQQSPSIISFMSDPALLGPHFSGPSWDRWRAVLRAAFCLPMSDRDRELFAEVSGNRAPPTRRVKELVCCVGRGGGKDSIAGALATFIAVTGDFTRLRPGEKATVMTLATDRRQAGIAFDYIRANIEETPLLSALLAGPPKDGKVELRNGASIEVTTNNPRAPRGLTIACAIYDECAFWRGEDFANPDTEVDAAIGPGLMRFPGAVKIIISSVHRRDGLLYSKFSRHFGKDDDDTLVVMGTSFDFNSTLNKAAIDLELERDPEKAGAEYLSQWRDDLSTFLDRALVEQAITRGIASWPPENGIRYSAFADPSGGRGDSFTAAIGHRDGNLVVVDALFEKRAPFDSDLTIDDLCALLRHYHVAEVFGDDYGADLTVAAFKRRGLRYTNLKLPDGEARKGKLNRSEIYLNSVQLFTAGRVRLPDNPRLVHQLTSLERRASRSSGHDTVDHPAGGHDDLSNACCGCLVALAGKASGRWNISQEMLDRAGPASGRRVGFGVLGGLPGRGYRL